MPFFGDPQVCYSYIALVVHEEILRLDVSVEDTLIVHVLKANYAASNEELRLLLSESFSTVEMVSKVSTSN